MFNMFFFTHLSWWMKIISPTSKSSELLWVTFPNVKWDSLEAEFSAHSTSLLPQRFPHPAKISALRTWRSRTSCRQWTNVCRETMGGQAKVSALGLENPDGRKTKTCLGRIHPFFGVRANKNANKDDPECFLIWVWKIVDPKVQQGFMTTDPFQVYPIGYVSNFGSSGSSSWRLFQCHASQPRLRTMSFCVKVPTVNRMPPGFSLATPNHHPSFYSRFFNRMIECR